MQKRLEITNQIKYLITRLDLAAIPSKMSEKIFVDGMILKDGKFNEGKPHLKLSIKVAEFAKFVKDHAKGDWLNLEIKTSKGGKTYAELDTWEPNKTEQEDDLPFQL